MRPYSFPRESRLLTSAGFQGVFGEAQLKAQTKELLVLARKSGQMSARLGLVVGKKHAKLAVSRNRIKRVVRESFRHHQDRLQGLDLVVLARPGISDITQKDLRVMVDALWGRLKPNRRGPTRSKRG